MILSEFIIKILHNNIVVIIDPVVTSCQLDLVFFSWLFLCLCCRDQQFPAGQLQYQQLTPRLSRSPEQTCREGQCRCSMFSLKNSLGPQWSWLTLILVCDACQQDPADDWTEHISSSGKKYYYNCRTEVSQWEKPKDLLERWGCWSETTSKVIERIYILVQGLLLSGHQVITMYRFCVWAAVSQICVPYFLHFRTHLNAFNLLNAVRLI